MCGYPRLVLIDVLGLERRFAGVSVAELETFNALGFAWGCFDWRGPSTGTVWYLSAISTCSMAWFILRDGFLFFVFEKRFLSCCEPFSPPFSFVRWFVR